ncbi:16058_t:CDS:2 [Cetraspora pellucida]|uniref:16058_t:CDS:1 n=1 Tax=Cetraspora pellucida TaxID=1433469 RepID=A0ACA9MG01_9GLOM|nr:16058_t:CDS:2 [Cetraspora pellucida]
MQESEETCEVVRSQKGKDKLNVRGYLMVKEKNVRNKYYWCCEFRKSKKCNGRATTLLIKNLHYLQDMSEHKHLPDASRVEVVKAITEVKKRASQSKEKPVQLIQNYMATLSEDVKPFLPSHNALRKTVVRSRKTVQLPQPQHALNFDLPPTLCNTLNGDLFLIEDRIDGQSRTLIFSTNENIKRLSKAPYWIMDGTFKTVPTIFYQLYTIHAPVGPEENSRILPLVYALMTNKSEESYRRFFNGLITFAQQIGIQLNPKWIITDFERAAINASQLGEYGTAGVGIILNDNLKVGNLTISS